MNFRENEDAVSPVIGVILMVAITVILAAVIAAFVFGMAGNVATTKTVPLQAKLTTTGSGDTADTITITYIGGGDTQELSGMKLSINGVAQEFSTTYATAAGDTTATKLLSAGSVWTFTSAAAMNDDVFLKNAGHNYQIVMTGIFNDGVEQVVLTQNI